jgi:hypothetical protein
MDANKVRMLMVTAMGAAALATTANAVACEQCLTDKNHVNSGICWSGFSTGSGSCYGGQQDNTWCTLDSSCYSPNSDDFTVTCQYNNWYSGSTCS